MSMVDKRGWEFFMFASDAHVISLSIQTQGVSR